MEEKKTNKRLIIVAILIILIVGLLLLGFILFNNYNNNKTNSTAKEIKESEEIEETDELDFDFDELSKTLKEAINNNKKAIIIECYNIEVPEGEPPQTEDIKKEISSNSIDTVVEKLKNAESMQERTNSWFGCPPEAISYYISTLTDDSEQFNKDKVFSLNYAGDGKTLAVGYKEKGYVFIFKSEDDIKDFIETLK